MKPTTLTIIKSALASDDTISREQVDSLLNKFRDYQPKLQPRPGSIKQAAEILAVHPVTIRRYAQAGLLTPIRITARNVHYDLNEVEALANTGRST